MSQLNKFRQNLIEHGLTFKGYNDNKLLFGDAQSYETFKSALDGLIIYTSFDISSYRAFVKWLQIFKDSNLYNHAYHLNLDIRNSNNWNDPAMILEDELLMLTDMVANSTSLKEIELENFKLTAGDTTIFFDAINSNNNIISLSFLSEFNTWGHYDIIFAKIAHNRELRELNLHDTDGILTDTIDQLFGKLRENNSLIEKLDLSFALTNQNFTALIQFLESDNKLIGLNIESSLDLAGVDIELCDRFWLVTNRKNLITDLNIINFTARQIELMTLDNIVSLTIYKYEEDGKSVV